MQLKKLFESQYHKFSMFSADAKVLLKANFLFSMVVPFVMVFSNAYIWRSTQSIYLVIIFFISHFVGNPIGFVLNGLLLKRFPVKIMFISGMLMFVLAMALLVFLENVTVVNLIIFGIGNGIGSGFYWSNRNFLTITSTVDKNRNFFNGLEYIFQAISGIFSPLFFGLFIGLGEKFELIKAQNAYEISIFFAVLLVVAASQMIKKGRFPVPPPEKIFHFTFNENWNKTRLLAFIMGFYHFGILALPPLLILNFIGNEDSLGIIDSLSNVTAFIVIYVVSSKALPAHRPFVMAVGTAIFLLGAVCFGLFYSITGVLILQAAFYLTDSLLNFPYKAVFMKVIDHLKTIEGKSQYSYLLDIEQFNAAGRIMAGVIFLILYNYVSAEFSLKTIIVIIAIMQILNVVLAKKLQKIID